MSSQWIPLLALLVLANGAPVLLALLRRGTLARPLDGGRVLWDGSPVFGPSKTWWGLFAALVVTPVAAWFLGLTWGLGLTIAIGAMAGDLMASLIKRRLGLASSTSVPLLDQVPEALIPALFAKGAMGLSWLDLGLAVAVFMVLDLVLTPLVKRLSAFGPR